MIFIRVSGSRNPKYEAASPLRLHFRTQSLRCRTPVTYLTSKGLWEAQCPSPCGLNVGGGNLVTNVACRAEASGARGPLLLAGQSCVNLQTRDLARVSPGDSASCSVTSLGEPGAPRADGACSMDSTCAPVSRWGHADLISRRPEPRLHPGSLRPAPPNSRPTPPGAPRLSASPAQLPPLRFFHVFPHHAF